MNKKNTRKEELLKQHFGSLQSTKELEYFVSEFLGNTRNMTEEIFYILNKSYEDQDAPYSYDDIPSYYYDEDELINGFMDAFEELQDEEEIKDTLENINEDLYHNKETRDERKERVKKFLKSLDLEELKDIFENSLNLDLNLEDFERQVEIYQWFLMDDRIIYQLEQKGEVTLNGIYWGRQCCGQHISMDGVIIEIFKEWFLNLHWIEEKFNLNAEVETKKEV